MTGRLAVQIPIGTNHGLVKGIKQQVLAAAFDLVVRAIARRLAGWVFETGQSCDKVCRRAD